MGTDDQSRLDVAIADTRGRRLRMSGLSSWLRRVAPVRARGSVSIALVSDSRARALNRRYRRKDYATDVLSFPAETSSPLVERFLGDIVIARGVARRQARRAGHGELTELRVLALHGLLHLLGYDHERDDGRMQRVERRLRVKGGLQDSLIDRSVTSCPGHARARQARGARVVTFCSGYTRAPRHERVRRGGGAPRG